MREYLHRHSYLEAAVRFKNLDENATHHIYSLLAWANAGNTFRFAFDQRYDGAIGQVTTTVGPGGTTIIADTSFPSGSYEVILFNHLGEYDKVGVTNALGGPILTINGTQGSELTYTYTANNAIVKYAYYYHKAEALSPRGTLSLKPGAPFYNWSLAWRELMDVRMLD
jgi:hypothetical protein